MQSSCAGKSLTPLAIDTISRLAACAANVPICTIGPVSSLQVILPSRNDHCQACEETIAPSGSANMHRSAHQFAHYGIAWRRFSKDLACSTRIKALLASHSRSSSHNGQPCDLVIPLHTGCLFLSSISDSFGPEIRSLSRANRFSPHSEAA